MDPVFARITGDSGNSGDGAGGSYTGESSIISNVNGSCVQYIATPADTQTITCVRSAEYDNDQFSSTFAEFEETILLWISSTNPNPGGQTASQPA